MEWINVNNELPKVGEEILFTNGKLICKGFYGFRSEFSKDEGIGFIDRESWDDGTGYDFFEEDTTHWMYLPEMPSVGN